MENITTYKKVYMSPEIFIKLHLEDGKERKIDPFKDQIWAISYLILEKYESSDLMQDFYNFDEGKFEYESFYEKIDAILKRNLQKISKVFLQFLKDKVFVK